jgi:NAD(P)-dependent dehydrogenase (short-subunit alcohol dehydrogenase family)
MMDLRLAGKSALITGASKGIGLACAKALAAEGCHAVIAARNPDGLAAAKTAIEAVAKGPAITAVTADLAKQEDRAMLIERFGACEILVNNAGANPPGEIDTVADEVWRNAWELKLFGYIAMTRGFYSKMKKRRDGVIVNIVGVAGERMNADYILGSTGNIALMGNGDEQSAWRTLSRPWCPRHCGQSGLYRNGARHHDDEIYSRARVRYAGPLAGLL